MNISRGILALLWLNFLLTQIKNFNKDKKALMICENLGKHPLTFWVPILGSRCNYWVSGATGGWCWTTGSQIEGFWFSAQEFHKSAAKVEKFVMLENVESLREQKESHLLWPLLRCRICERGKIQEEMITLHISHTPQRPPCVNIIS